MITFPSNPTIGQLHEVGGRSFRFNGTGWVVAAITSGGGNVLIIPKTYAELSALKSTNALVSGQKYLLTDYATKHVIPYSDPVEINTGSLEPLILTAANDHEFHAEVISTVHASDIIHYRFDDDSCEDGTRNSETKKWDGGTLRHGWITYRKSTSNLLSTYFDWRNYKVRRWKLDCQAWVSEGSYSNKDLAKDSNGNIYVSKTNHAALTVSPSSDAVNWQLAVDLSLQDEGLFLSWTPEVSNFNIGDAKSDNLIISNAVKGTDYDDYYTFCINSERYNGSGVITDNSNGSLVGEGFFNIEIGDLQFDYIVMTLGLEAYHNNIFFMLDSEESGLFYRNNKIGSNCFNNTIGNSFQSNTIGNDFSNNSIGNDFHYNTIGDSFYSNSIGNDFSNNSIGNDFRSNTIGNEFYYNTIGDYFQYNNFSTSTHVYAAYGCTLFRNAGLTWRLTYYNASDVLTIVDATA